MGLREIGGGEWVTAKELDDGEIALDKVKYLGLGENDNGSFCMFQDGKKTVNVGGTTLLTAVNNIDIGDVVRVVYEGQTSFKNGRKGAMWKLFVYDDEEENGSTDDVSDEDESEEEVEVAVKTARKKSSKKASKKATKATKATKASKKVEEAEEDDLDDLDDLE